MGKAVSAAAKGIGKTVKLTGAEKLSPEELKLLDETVAQDVMQMTPDERRAAIAASRGMSEGEMTGLSQNATIIPEGSRIKSDIKYLNNKGIAVRSPDKQTFVITDVDKYIEHVKESYPANNPMNPVVEQQIRNYIQPDTGPTRPVRQIDGMPGTHAEVKTYNQLLNEGRADNAAISVYKTDGKHANEPFPACPNCCGVIPCDVNLTSGRTR